MMRARPIVTNENLRRDIILFGRIMCKKMCVYKTVYYLDQVFTCSHEVLGSEIPSGAS